MKRKISQIFGLGILSASLILFACGCKNQNPVASASDYYFNTIITITLYGESNMDKINECFKIADHYEKLLSNTIETSDVSNINNHPGQYVEVDQDTLEVIEKALTYCKEDASGLDITIGKVTDLWNFSEVAANTNKANNEVDQSCIPSSEEIAELIKHVDYHSVDIKDNQVCLTDPKAKLDLGAIAKGFIADKMKEYLNQQGINKGTINLGGNVLTLGLKDDKESYRIGIQKPFTNTGEAMIKLYVDDKSVVTSGIYERYFTVDGKRYHHILNKNDGYPVENNLYSVTIISDCSVDGDALSTTTFIKGLEDGKSYIETLDGIEALFITDQMEVIPTSGLKKNVDFEILSK